MVKGLLAKAMQAPAMTSVRPSADTETRGSAAVGGKGSNGSCAAVIAERANNGRSAAMRPILRARDDIWYNHPDELALLLDDCVDANMRDDGGSTLLHTAASRDRIEAAKVLLAHGADRKRTDKDGRLPADYASSAEMRALLGAPSAPPRISTAPGSSPANATRKRECAQKHSADAVLCGDTSCQIRANTHWQKCLKTGEYW